VVTIAEPESISPLMVGRSKDLDQNDTLDLDKSAKQYRASVSGKRLSGRPSIERLGSAARQAIAGNPSLSSLISDDSDPPASAAQHGRAHESLLKQVQSWLKDEKARRTARKAKRKASSKDASQATKSHEDTAAGTDVTPSRERRGSGSSEGSVALENLANILEKSLSLKSSEKAPRRRRSSYRLSAMLKRHSAASSDTEYFDSVDQLVPSCDAVLDNSKTLAYGGGAPEPGVKEAGLSRQNSLNRDREAWSTFKYEIVRLAHTLKLKGWRRVPLELSNAVGVERLSGALTNAVYVVSPPKDLPSQTFQAEDGDTRPTPRNPPPKLLLRIYGPQVEHLIDREAELQILQRLARKHIGPRLLGTFSNGRFEEYLHAKTLTFEDLRIPDTSKQIAKRMRELHEGIDLLEKERNDGPFVWRNWDKWVNRCGQVISWLDEQILEYQKNSTSSASDAWKQRGFICGVQWPIFRQMIEKYRQWLEEQYGGPGGVNERLVFAHNDAQYGNILRLLPSGESPLLLPANEHKQLVVIDFEYANANLPGLEFANHFTEWCYNYHSEFPFRCNTGYYPTPEEQHRFIRAYLLHNPSYKAPGRNASLPPTPQLRPLSSSGSATAAAATATPSSISAFMLDSRAPPGERVSYHEQEAQSEQKTEQEIERLMAETRIWRLANSAQWVAWGIVQAHIPGLPDFENKDGKQDGGRNVNSELESATKEMKDEARNEEGGKGEKEADEDEEFDYLAYAQERAMFVWGDAIQLGIVRKEDLPEKVRGGVKIVEY
ncbi:kinase-like protein, partial [Lojkania enalia]